MPIAIITGVNGQDGSYLAEFLLEMNYTVIGWIPDHIQVSFDYIDHILDKIQLTKGNLSNQKHLNWLIAEFLPDEVYHFASPSSPAKSWNSVIDVGDAAGLGVARFLEAIRKVKPDTKFYQASSSELFGIPAEVPQNEKTPFRPRNPYGVAKLFAHMMVVNYRNKYGMYSAAGILYNHESPRRSPEFVTRKISQGAAKIKLGLSNSLHLGDLDARRDWGYARDYIEAIYAIMHQDTPQDFVIGTGITHSVRDFCEAAFKFLDLDYKDYVVQDPNLTRPHEQKQLVANPLKAKNELGWEAKTGFDDLAELMVKADLDQLRKNHVV